MFLRYLKNEKAKVFGDISFVYEYFTNKTC